MTLHADDLATLRELEETLWIAATRHDPALMDRTFAAEMVEFGQSGRRYARAELILAPDPDAGIDATLPLPEYEVACIAPGVALATYTSVLRQGDRTLRARRASLWVRGDDGWRLRFHQGTPI